MLAARPPALRLTLGLLLTHPAPNSLRAQHSDAKRSRDPQIGTTTPVPDDNVQHLSPSPFYFRGGWAGWAKRPSRPFPPPFFSPPSGSFSDPLSTHHRSAHRRPHLHGELIRGLTNGDDAVLVSDSLIACTDGVGAWAHRERGHAPLWSRLILHFWALAAERDRYGADAGTPQPVRYLEQAYAATREALSGADEWLGTTTVCGALLHGAGSPPHPLLYVTQLGDSKVLVIRPSEGELEKRVVFATEEQWHYFDCPRQLGTNSPDTPEADAVLSTVDVRIDDVVLAMSDGVTDNLWEHEIAANVVESMEKWAAGSRRRTGVDVDEEGGDAEGMRFVAQELVKAARTIAEDPFAESPFMERAVEEGLAIEGGKLDDISVVAALCKRRKG